LAGRNISLPRIELRLLVAKEKLLATAQAKFKIRTQGGVNP
jgi:hypothetical protein